MNFLYPAFLLALFAILIPIIIHLFNFRRYKKVYFTNVQFLKDIKQESDSKSKLKELLILAMRVLAITCLVFAFAQPYLPINNKSISAGKKTISVYVDNSFSMEQLSKQGTLFENAKLIAKDIANTFDVNDQFQILTNDFEAEHQRLLSKEEFIDRVNEIKISSANKTISDVLKRQQDFVISESGKQKQLFVLSDFQQNNTVVKNCKIDSSINVNLVSIKATQSNNVYVDSVWISSPVMQINSAQTIYARIKNSSTKAIENATLKLYINNNQVALTDFKATANSQTIVNTTFTIKQNGVNQGVLKIDDYPISFDDEFYFSFTTQPIINVSVINGKDANTGLYFKSLYANDSLYNYYEYSESAIDYAQFLKSEVLVLNELSTLSSGLVTELQKYIKAGGSLVIFPSSKINLTEYNNAFSLLKLPLITKIDTASTRTQQINFEQGFYDGVFENTTDKIDLPKVFEYAIFTKQTASNEQQIIALQNGASFLSYFPNNGGKIYLFASPSHLNATNFLKHALFVPTFIRIGLLSLKPSSLYYTSASNQAIKVPNYQLSSNYKPLHIINNEKTRDVIPEHKIINNEMVLFTQNQINDAGHYSVLDEEKNLLGLAFNVDRKESEMKFYNDDELKNQIDEAGLKNITVITANEKISKLLSGQLNEGKKLWKLFLILALVFLLAEIILVRLFKN